MDLKNQIKTHLLANNLNSSLSEIPLKTIVKDVFNFKVFTADPYTYFNFKLVIGTSYKIGIILAFLLPLGLWIYSLISFLGANSEVNQLQTELKETEYSQGKRKWNEK